MLLIRNHTFKDTIDLKYKPSFGNCKKNSDKDFEVHDSTEKVR